MFSFFNKTKERKGTWVKVSNLVAGVEIAVPEEGPQAQPQHLHWDEIVSIKPVGREQVYDIEVEGTHNFIGNDIFAHNTYVLKSGTFAANAPAELTADGTGVDLAKVATYALSEEQKLAEKVNADEMAMVSLKTRVEALESGNVGTGTLGTGTLSTGLASAFQSFGALIQKGIAQFNTLVFQRLVAATDSTGASSAGSVNILTGNTVAQVNNSLVLPSTKIFVTFNSQITGSWWVSDKTAGSFRVVLSAPQAGDVSFDYFLVQTEGQLAMNTPPDSAAGAEAKSGTGTGTPISGADTTAPVITATSTPDTGRQTHESGGSQTSTSTPVSTDITPPVVTLLGDAAMQMTATSTPFIDPGATATDETDGPLTPVASGTVDTTTVGTYTIIYTATDKAGNIGTASRLVTVVPVVIVVTASTE